MGEWDLTMRLAVAYLLARAALALMLAGAAGVLAVGAWVAWDTNAYQRRMERRREA